MIDELDDDVNDVWPGFVDALTSVVMFLLLGLVSVVLSTHFERVDRLAQDKDLAKDRSGVVAARLNAILDEGAVSAEIPNELRDRCREEGWDVVCTFRQQINFPSGRWRPSDAGLAEAQLARVAKYLRALDANDEVLKVIVEGHADRDRLDDGARDMTNWELSSARAGYVVRLLQDKLGVRAELMQAIGYAEHRPPRPDASKEEQRFVALRVRLAGTILEGAPQ